jgi:hypothetical protein
MVGGELVFVLEGGCAGFWPSQDKGTTIEDRRRKRVTGLIKDHNPRGIALLNERIEMFLFFMNILRKKIYLFCNHFFVNISCTFNIDPDLRSQPIGSDGGTLVIIKICTWAPDKNPLINNYSIFV